MAPVTLPAALTVYRRDALGFASVIGALETPPEEPQPAGSADDPAYVDVQGLFGKVRKYRPKGGWRKLGRRR
jgi:hypothetical protein